MYTPVRTTTPSPAAPCAPRSHYTEARHLALPTHAHSDSNEKQAGPTTTAGACSAGASCLPPAAADHNEILAHHNTCCLLLLEQHQAPGRPLQWTRAAASTHCPFILKRRGGEAQRTQEQGKRVRADPGSDQERRLKLPSLALPGIIHAAASACRHAAAAPSSRPP